jgi:hypothetical protein
MKSVDTLIGTLIALVLAGTMGWLLLVSPVPGRATLVSVEPALATGQIAFDSFGPSHSFGTNSWAAGEKAHAEWFCPVVSGRLHAIELAIEPPSKEAGNATVFIAATKRNFPGATIESFTVTPAMTVSGSKAQPVILNSVAQPLLEAGEKYWVGVRSDSGWLWHFNDQKIIQNAARETKRNRWASAGDYCYVSAFRIIVVTNQQTATNLN